MANAQVNTYSGRTILWQRIKGNGTEPNFIGWGDSTVTGSAAANVNMFKPQSEARVNGSTSVVTTSFLGDTYRVVGTVTCAVGAKNITEAGLFDTITNSPTTVISASLAIGGTSITVSSATGLPTSGNYYAQLENETVLVTGSATPTMTLSRSQLGSTTAVHVSGTAFTIGGDGGASATGTATSGQTATVGATQGGSIFAHADFGAISLGVSDAIAFTWLDTLT